MKKNKESALLGTGKVYTFSLTQTLKNKANIISLVVVFVLTAFIRPFMSLMNSSGTLTFRLDRVTIVNETDLTVTDDLLKEVLKPYSYLSTDQFTISDESELTLLSSLTAEDAVVVLETAEPKEGDEEGTASYQASIRVLPDNEISELATSLLKSAMTDLLLQARLQNIAVTDEAYAILSAGLSTEDGSLASYMDRSNRDSYFMLQLIYSVVVMMVSVYSISYIIQSIVEEKTSKLVELLMVSIRPLALVLGKILAALTYVAILFAVMVTGLAFSSFLSALIGFAKGDSATILSVVNSFTGGAGAASGATPPMIILAFVVSILLGIITFSILAGITGASCSTMEDAQSAMGLSMLLIMGGYMISILVSVGSGNSVLQHVLSLVPVLSVYCAPTNFLMGSISFPVLLIAWILQAAIAAFLAYVCGNVYEGLLVYRGERPGFGKILKMAGIGKRTTDKEVKN